MDFQLGPFHALFPFLLTVLVLGLVFFTAYMVLGGARRLMDKLRDEVGPRFLREKTPTLLRWEWTRALQDLSSLTRRRGQSTGLQGGRSHRRGTMQSLADRHEAWLAYTVDRQRRAGIVKIHTSDNTMEIHVRHGGGTFPGRHAMVVADGAPLGSYNFETREIFGPDGRGLGRITGGLRILTQGIPDYHVLELEGREVVAVNFEPFSPLERLGPMPAVFLLRLPKISRNEEWWLLATLGIALFEESLSSDP
jgi:hypothetical protein